MRSIAAMPASASQENRGSVLLISTSDRAYTCGSLGCRQFTSDILRHAAGREYLWRSTFGMCGTPQPAIYLDEAGLWTKAGIIL